MQNYLFAAAALTILVGIVHSVLGEILIFRKLRSGTVVPTHAAPPLAERHIHILWATWHVVTVFGFAFAAVFVQLGSASTAGSFEAIVLKASCAAFFAASLLVLVGTKGRHPGWIGLAGVAALVVMALAALI